MIQRTFVMFKANSVNLGSWPEIILDFFIKPGFNICGLKMFIPTKQQLQKHYKHLEPKVRNRVISDMLKIPVVAMVVEGDEAVSRIHEAAGSTAPGEATRSTIRRRYGHVSRNTMFSSQASKMLANTIHTSATQREAEEETNIFFLPEEIHGFRPAYTLYAY